MGSELEGLFDRHFRCARCGGSSPETGVVTTEGGALSSAFHLPAHRFLKVTCDKCGYTDFFDKANLEAWVEGGNSVASLYTPKGTAS
jgi:hypothetical protein